MEIYNLERFISFASLYHYANYCIVPTKTLLQKLSTFFQNFSPLNAYSWGLEENYTKEFGLRPIKNQIFFLCGGEITIGIYVTGTATRPSKCLKSYKMFSYYAETSPKETFSFFFLAKGIGLKRLDGRGRIPTGKLPFSNLTENLKKASNHFAKIWQFCHQIKRYNQEGYKMVLMITWNPSANFGLDKHDLFLYVMHVYLKWGYPSR